MGAPHVWLWGTAPNCERMCSTTHTARNQTPEICYRNRSPSTPAPLSPCPLVPLSPFTPAPLSPCPPVPLYPCAPVPLHPSTPVPLYPCTPVPLCPCTPVPLYPCIPVPLRPYTPIVGAPAVTSTPSMASTQACNAIACRHPARDRHSLAPILVDHGGVGTLVRPSSLGTPSQAQPWSPQLGVGRHPSTGTHRQAPIRTVHNRLVTSQSCLALFLMLTLTNGPEHDRYPWP